MLDLTHRDLGQYHLTELVRQGGMSMVYKAYQPSLERYVAVKVLMPMQDPQFASRFKREARAIAHLQHPNILPIYDFSEQDGLLYIVLQYIEQGRTLSDVLGHPLDPLLAIQLARYVLDALDYAHQRNIVHRDIKPGNILMPSPTWPMLADFGIAKLLNESQQLTMANLIMGTPVYIAPEQALGRAIDPRTDIYSFGVVLFEMLTGQVPFDADTTVAVMAKHAYEHPPSPRSLNPDLPAEIETILFRALEKDPARRYQSAADMANDLRRITPLIERSMQGQVVALYHAGVDAYSERRWEDAAAQLERVVALDPGYEDATALLQVIHEQIESGSAATGWDSGNSYDSHQTRKLTTATPLAVGGSTVRLTPTAASTVLVSDASALQATPTPTPVEPVAVPTGGAAVQSLRHPTRARLMVSLISVSVVLALLALLARFLGLW